MQASLPFTREMWATFMREYWQKRPVVIRGALPAEAAMPIDADELAGLACESEFQPRVINKGAGGSADWSLELGPFTEQELQALPSDGSWCVILSDLEKHVRTWPPSSISLIISPSGAWQTCRRAYLEIEVVLARIPTSSTFSSCRVRDASNGRYPLTRNIARK